MIYMILTGLKLESLFNYYYFFFRIVCTSGSEPTPEDASRFMTSCLPKLN